MTTECINGVDVSAQNFNKLKFTSIGFIKGGRTRTLYHANTGLITPPGIRPIKQVELY